MRNRSKWLWIAGSLLAVVLVSGGLWLQQPEGARLAQTRCFRCHLPWTVYGERKDAESWQTTVRRMENHGLQVTEEERDQIVDHLAEVRGPQ